MTAPTHPDPSAMAREAYPSHPIDGTEQRTMLRHMRENFAAGVAAERARVAAWLRNRALQEVDGRSILCARLADELEGKVQP